MSGLATCAFGIADLVVGNVERLNVYVRTGLLDAVLVRPMGVLAQLAAMDVAARRVGRVAFGVAIVVVAAVVAGVPPTPARLVLLVITPLAGAAIFAALVAHDLADIERLSRRIVVIDGGRVVHDGSLEDLHARYGSRRRVVVDLDEPLATPITLPGVVTESVETDGRRITFALDGSATTAGELVRRLAETTSLRDISVLEPDIEDVAARLYTRSR